MKANELMIGDWVICSDTTPFKIVSIESDEPFYFVEGSDGFKVDCGDVKPIPLTLSILSMSGLLADKNIIEKDYVYGEDSTIDISKTAVYLKDEVVTHWNISAHIHETHINEGVMFNMKFHYVHELQHALRLCGLEEMADNFIVLKNNC